jgi:phospholipid N-methyltransferase
VSADSSYRASAEFYELVARRQTPSSGPALRAALAPVDSAAGPVLEIGAGTGSITRVIADALPDAEIVATEPSDPMRAILTSRVSADADLRRRVTVTPHLAQGLPDCGPFCAAVLFGVVGHLPPPERRLLWAQLRDRMPAGAPIVVELMGVARPRPIPPVRLLRERIGLQTYEWWSTARPSGRDIMRFDTTWKVLRDGELLREVAESYDWYTLSVADLAAESGLTAERIKDVDGATTAEIAVLTRD